MYHKNGLTLEKPNPPQKKQNKTKHKSKKTQETKNKTKKQKTNKQTKQNKTRRWCVEWFILPVNVGFTSIVSSDFHETYHDNILLHLYLFLLSNQFATKEIEVLTAK